MDPISHPETFDKDTKEGLLGAENYYEEAKMQPP
jgi:hypothetical protein